MGRQGRCGPTAQLDIPRAVDALSAVRRAAVHILESWGFGDPSWLGKAAVVVNELVSVMLAQGTGPLVLSLACRDREVRVTVVQHRGRQETNDRVVRDHDSDELAKRIVGALTQRWSFDHQLVNGSGEKGAWAVLLPAAIEPGRFVDWPTGAQSAPFAGGANA
jgi:hypothetical protein